MQNNEMRLSVKALSQNEAFARVAVAAFFAQLNPTLAELGDIKTAVSEAVTNAIIHGYQNRAHEFVDIYCRSTGENECYIEICDKGVGIEDVAAAMEPLYTSKPELERSGMGFTVMETFMDGLEVYSEPGKGTRIVMKKRLSANESQLQQDNSNG